MPNQPPMVSSQPLPILRKGFGFAWAGLLLLGIIAAGATGDEIVQPTTRPASPSTQEVDLRPYGVPGDIRSIRPPAPFMSSKGNAARVVFLCDGSGSMLTTFDTLRRELNKAIEALRPIQSFNILFFDKESYRALDQKAIPATPTNKRNARDFLDQMAITGSSDPIPGLKAAFACEPHLIYLLTNGDFPNNDKVIEEIRKLNANKKVRINTIAYMDKGESYQKALATIAKENGGIFKFVDEKALDK